MRKLHIVGLMLFAVFAFGASALATTASAVTEFLCDGVACKAGEELPIDGSSTDIVLAILGELFTVLCEKVTGTGDITGPKTDKFLTIVFEKCKTSLGTECIVSADNLPWNSELIGTAGVDEIFSSGAGSPGWKSVCSGKENLCEAKLLETKAEDYGVDLANLAGGLVDMEFLEAEEAGPCFEGTTELAADGAVTGLVTLECLDPATLLKLECAVS
jgi:hypothetical protein